MSKKYDEGFSDGKKEGYKSGKGYHELDLKLGLFFGLVLGLMMGALFFIGFDWGSGTEELGTAICLEEYNMDFSHFNHIRDGTLHCKPFPEQEKDYDGLKVNLGED